MRRSRPFRRDGQRARGDSGAVLVEFAITVPILITLLFAIIDFGFVYNDWINVRQGGRDGIREAIVNSQPAGTCNCTLAGTAPAVDMKDIACYTKARVALNDANTRVKITYCDGTKSTATCPAGVTPSTGFKSGLPLKICVQYQTGSITGLFSNLLDDKVLTTEVESLIETVNDVAAPTGSYEEPGLTSWSSSCNVL